jgi:hypothetical protein
MKNRLENIKTIWAMGSVFDDDVNWLISEVERLWGELGLEEYNAEVEGTVGDVERLMAEVKRLRAVRIADLESVGAYGKHLGAAEHVQCSKRTIGDDVVWKAHKLAAALRFNETGEKCPGCAGFRWAHE